MSTAATTARGEPYERPSNDRMSRGPIGRTAGYRPTTAGAPPQQATGHIIVGDGRNPTAGKLAHSETVGTSAATEQGPILITPCGGDDTVDTLREQLLAHLSEFIGRVSALGHDGEEVPLRHVRDAPETGPMKGLLRSETMTPMVPVRPRRSEDAWRFARYPSDSAASTTRSRVARFTSELRSALSARDAVETSTPARSATSLRVTFGTRHLLRPASATLTGRSSSERTHPVVGPRTPRGPGGDATRPLLGSVMSTYHSGATAGSSALSMVTFTDGMNFTMRSLVSPVSTS